MKNIIHKKIKLISVLTIASIVSFSSCTKQENNPEMHSHSYIVLGDAYIDYPNVDFDMSGSNSYKLDGDSLVKKGGMLIPTSIEAVNEDFFHVKSINCSDTIKEKILELIAKIPPQLFDESDVIICHEKNTIISEGSEVILYDSSIHYIYIELKDKSGNRRFWLLDLDKDDLPVYLHSFVDKYYALMNVLGQLE